MIVIIQQFMATIIGSFLLAIGVNGFLVPNHLIDGGILGIALILHYFFDIQTGMIMAALSLPICLMASKNKRRSFFNNIQGLLFSSLFIDFLSPLRYQIDVSTLSGALIGGVVIGTGVGLMLRYKTSTGGTDLLAKMISSNFPINIAVTIILIDGLIVLAGFAVLPSDRILYSCVAIAAVGLTTSLIERELYV